MRHRSLPGGFQNLRSASPSPRTISCMMCASFPILSWHWILRCVHICNSSITVVHGQSLEPSSCIAMPLSTLTSPAVHVAHGMQPQLHAPHRWHSSLRRWCSVCCRGPGCTCGSSRSRPWTMTCSSGGCPEKPSLALWGTRSSSNGCVSPSHVLLATMMTCILLCWSCPVPAGPPCTAVC